MDWFYLVRIFVAMSDDDDDGVSGADVGLRVDFEVEKLRIRSRQ
jgi:hypothetical protein